MQKIFFSQSILDSLINEGRITLEGNVLTLLSSDRPSFELEPGYRIGRTADNGPDPNGLVGQIRYERDLRAEKAEIFLDSLIYRDTAYVAEPGFIGEKKELIDSLSDTDLLARFLLDSLL
ncbi:MAG: hypothetical protein A2010_11175 [Nitrospirae bacterium GWD2_57_9]|nr:MAG: hypothetical protein A2010_11175 [Nitrospirae bacterium GWD2_57_9]OGW50440.1 MAG: hypothetical protein A2078_06630 [Nitrospirae bacterium GWC2_57_9]